MQASAGVQSHLVRLKLKKEHRVCAERETNITKYLECLSLEQEVTESCFCSECSYCAISTIHMTKRSACSGYSSWGFWCLCIAF